MSLFIKGATLPKECFDCPCYNSENGYCKVERRSTSGDVPKWCPLVEVLTPHGDLIDAEVEMRLMQSYDYDTYEDYSRAFDMLDNAPTIIPAERYLTINIPEHLVKEWSRSVGAEIVVLCKDCYWHNQCRFEQELGLEGFYSKGERREDGKQ